MNHFRKDLNRSMVFAKLTIQKLNIIFGATEVTNDLPLKTIVNMTLITFIANQSHEL